MFLFVSPQLPISGANTRKRSREMRRSRPPFQDKDAGARRAAQASVARKKRLLPLSSSPEPARSSGDAPDSTVTRTSAITSETASPRGIQPGLRQYQAPTLQQPPQPWSDQSDTPLPLRASAEKGCPPITDESTPHSDTAGSPPPNADAPSAAATLSLEGGLAIAQSAALRGAAALGAVGSFGAETTVDGAHADAEPDGAGR
jgi:hypothetical protein